MVSFKTDNGISDQPSPQHRHLAGNLHDSLNHSHSHSQQQNSYGQHESVLPSRYTPPSQTTSYSTVPRSSCALHSRLDQPVTSSTPGMDDKKVVQAASTVASGPQVRNKCPDGSGVGASISGVRRRNGPQPGLRSPAAKRPLSAPVTLQGWLYKQGSEGLMLWKKRWFVLSEYCLFYYKGPEEEKLLGSILLPSYKVTICSPEDKVTKKFAFKAEHANMRTYHFAADTRDGMNQWVNVLTLATLLQDPNPGGGEVQVALDMAGSADGDRSARPSVSSISSILNQSADDSDSGFHGFQSRDDPSHASNNNSSPNSANTASFPNLSGSNSNSLGNGNNGNNNNNNNNNPDHVLEDGQPHHPVINGWMQPPAQFGQPGTSQQQPYGHILSGPLTQQHPPQQFHQQMQQQPLTSGQHQAMKHQHTGRPQSVNQQQHQHQHQPGPSNTQSGQQLPRNFGQPVYANAPPKPRRLTDGSNEYSPPSPDPAEFCKSPAQPSNIRLTTKSPMSDYERGNAIYASRLAQQQPQATLRTDKSGLNYGYTPGQPAERRTPDTYGRSAKSRPARGNSDYEDVYAGPQLYQRPAGPVGYTKGTAPVPIPTYAQHQQNQPPVCPTVSPSNAPVMRLPRVQPPPRPHSADFLEYEATRRPNQQSSNDSGSFTSQQPRPQRPKSSLDVVNSADPLPAGDGYFYSEERYAAQMRQSAVYLHQTPQHHQQQRNQSLSRATTPSKTNSHRLDDADSNNSVSMTETPCSTLRKLPREYSHRQHPIATQSLQRYTEASSNEALLRRSLRERTYDSSGVRDPLIHGESGTVPRRMPRDFDSSHGGGRLIGEGIASHATPNCHSSHAGPRRWSEQQFARSASARLPRTRYSNDQRDDNEYADRTPAQVSRDGERRIQQREESMKRLLEWKQRMLQSPLTRKPGSGTTNGGGTAQNELSSYYKRQALLDLAAHEATVAEARHSRRRDDNHRPHVRSKSTDGRRSIATNVSRYNSYSSDDEELNDVRRKRTRRPSHVGRSPRHSVEENTPVAPPAVAGSSHEVVPVNRANPSKGGANVHHQNVTSTCQISPPRPASSNYGHYNTTGSSLPLMGGIPPDAGYEEVSFSQVYRKDYTISVSSNCQGASADSPTAEPLKVKTPKKPSGILKTPTNYPISRHAANNETGILSTLAGYIPGETWQIQKNVQWGATDERQNWDSKIDESKVIKEFSYRYIKPEELEDLTIEGDDHLATADTKNFVQSRIRSFETGIDETTPVKEGPAMQEPLKLSPSQATEAHVSKLDSTRKTSPKLHESVSQDPNEDAVRLTDLQTENDGDSCQKQIVDSGKSVKDLLADFERKSQQVRRQEDDKREEVKHRGVFSDTETLLYDTGSDLDQPDRSDGEEDLYQTISKHCDNKNDRAIGAMDRDRNSTGDIQRERDSSNATLNEDSSVLENLQTSSNVEAFARLSMTESMVTHGDRLSGESATPSPPLNLDDINPEEHYLPMSPRKAILDPNNDDRPNPKMMESLFANLRGEESSYVEMAQNGMGHSLLAPNAEGGKHDSGDYSTLDTPHYEFVCVADNKVEPVYMEVSQLAESDEKKVGKSTKNRDKRDGHNNNGQLQVRGDLPDILAALKSDSSDADDESSKDLDSIDAPRHPRFSLSDTFRPASYYLGASRTMIAELHDSSDSELVSPPPIPTSPPPLDDLDSLDLQDSMDEKKMLPQVASTRDNSSTRSSPKSWNKPAGQVDSHGSSSRYSGTTISSTFRDSRISLESVSGSDSLELRNPDEEARHRQLKRRPVSDEVCEVLDSLDELESLGSRFDGASIDLDQYLEELQARDAFNVDLYAKDLSYNSIYGFNENLVVTDKLQKQSPRELTNKTNLASNNSLDHPFPYGCRGKTSSASSLPSMRVSDTPPAHQHSQSFTGDAHYENVTSFSPLRGSPAIRMENEQNQDDCRTQKDSRHGSQMISHNRDSSYTIGRSSNSASPCHRPNSAFSPSANVHQQHPGVNRNHARSASHDTPRDVMLPNHRSSSSQDSTFYPGASFPANPTHQNSRTPTGETFPIGMIHHHRHQHGEGDHAGAPYYYSDLQVSVSSVDAQLNRFAIGHTSRLPQLNNQRDDSSLNKRNDIGRLVNPITRQIPRRIEVEDIDEARRIAAELRKSSTQYLAEKKGGTVDKKNFYESDTLRRAKSSDPLPNEPLPDVSTVNLYPLGLRDKSNSQTNLELDDIVSQIEQTNQPSHRRSRSLEGLLDDVGLQNLVEQRHLPDRVSSVPPIRTQQHEYSSDMAPRISSFTPISVEDASNFDGEDPWEQDTLWHESLRKVSLRQARSLDNLENAARTPESIQQEFKTRARITRGATYVNDSVLQRQQIQASPQESVDRRSNERNQSEAERMDEPEDDDEGTYESLAITHRLTGEYIWDPENEAYRRQSSTNQRINQSHGAESKHFLSEGNLPPVVAIGANNRTSTSTSGSFELDREKLRQWDLVSSACLLQEQQRTSMAESGRGLPVSDDRQSRTIDAGDSRPIMMMMIESSRGRNDTRGNDAAVNFQRNDGKQVDQLGGTSFTKNKDNNGPKGEEEREEMEDEGADECRDGAAASGSGSVIGRDPLPPRAVSTSQLPQGTLTQPPSGVSTLPLPIANGGHRQQLPTFPVHQSTPQSTAHTNGNFINRVASAGDIRLSPVSVTNDPKTSRVSSPCGNGQLMISPARNMRIVSPIENRVSSPSDSERHMHSPSDRKAVSPINREMDRSGDGSLKPMQRIVQSRESTDFLHKRNNANNSKQRSGGSNGSGGRIGSTGGSSLVQVSAGELLGRTHEELVLLLIQLRRQSTALCKAMETCHMEIEAQALLTELDNPRRLENLQKLEELKKHLMDLEKQYEKGKPLVNLVDNMVKLGSLYNRNANNGTGSVSGSRHDLLQSQDTARDQRDRLEFNQRVQEQRLLAEERRDWDRLSPDHGQLQAKVQQLYKLDRLLQEESGTLHSLQQDKDILEKALGGLRHKLQGSRSNPAEVERYRKQQLLLERELSRVRLLLAHNSKKLEETVAENARLEQDLVVLRQKLQTSRRYAGNMARDTSGTTVALESELRRVQQLVGDLQRQRQELSIQVRQLTEKSHSLVQQIRPAASLTSSQIHNPKKRSQSSWLETDLDSGMTQNHGLDSPSSPALVESLPRNRQNGSSHQSHSRSRNNGKTLPGIAYKENSHSHPSKQHSRQSQANQQQQQHQQQQQTFVPPHPIIDSSQDHISALSPQVREQIQQHQLKQQLLKDRMQGKASPVQTNATPLYVNTDSRRHETPKHPELAIHNGLMVPPPEYIPPPPPPCSDETILLNGNYSNQEDNKFAGIHNREKQEIKTVRIVKRESERRQRDRGDRTGNIGIPVINGPQQLTTGSLKRQNDDESSAQQFEKVHLGRVIEESPIAHVQSNVRIADMEDTQFQRSMSLPRGFGGQRPHPGLHHGPVPPPPRSDSMNALRNIMARRHRVRFENHEGSSDSTSPYTDSPTSSSQIPMSSPNYSTSPSYSPSHQSYLTPYARTSSSQPQLLSPYQGSQSSSVGTQENTIGSFQNPSVTMSPDPVSPTPSQSVKERLFGSVASLNSLTESPQLSPVFKSEAAKQIIKEMTQKRSDGPQRRPIPKEKRRHYTVSSSKPIFDLEDAFSKMGMGRARDDLDMERALRPRINAPDVVRSTLSHKELKYNESTIDQLLGTPNKILIPERYVPEQTPELSAEEKKQRLKKADAIRKMLSETAVTTSEGDDDVIHNEKSHSLKKKVAEEKRQRDHILQLNQILAKQVMEKSKMVAVKALATLPLNSETSFDDEDLSPITPLPLYQQRENFYS